MEEPKSEIPQCDRCKRLMTFVDAVTVPEGGAVVIYRCPSCRRLFLGQTRHGK
jgi:hypothetical protein